MLHFDSSHYYTATYNKNGHEASNCSVPIFVWGSFTNKNTVENEISKA